MQPPYDITPTILKLTHEIGEKLGQVTAIYFHQVSPELRKVNRIKTIQASLQIEGNTLSAEQITALFDNKRVLGPAKDILEVQNAIEVYEQITTFNPHSLADFLKAHQLLMKGLLPDAGKFRTASVGIVKGNKVTHLAPPAQNVHYLMTNLLAYLRDSSDLVLIKSCVFHYEMEFIHPFMDGNGRMGRLWQTCILMEEYPVFQYLPFENLIKQYQNKYYEVLAISDKMGKSTVFIEYMLEIINQSLADLLQVQYQPLNALQRIQYYQSIVQNQPFTRKDYLQYFKSISTSTASRDLKKGVNKGILIKRGKHRLTTYQYDME